MAAGALSANDISKNLALSAKDMAELADNIEYDDFMREIGLEPRLNRTEMERHARIEEFLSMKIQEEAAEAAQSKANPSVFSHITGIPYPQLLFCIPLILCSWLMVLGFIMPYFKQRDMRPSYRGVSDMHIKKAYLLFAIMQLGLSFINCLSDGYPLDLVVYMCLISNTLFLILDTLYTNLMITGYMAKFRLFDKGRFDMVDRLFHAIWYTAPFILTYGTVWCTDDFLYYYYYVLAVLSFIGDMLCFRAFRMTISFKSLSRVPKIVTWFIGGSCFYLLSVYLCGLNPYYEDATSLKCEFTIVVLFVQTIGNIARLAWYDSRSV